MVSIFITAWNITAFPTGFLTVVIGFAMIIFFGKSAFWVFSANWPRLEMADWCWCSLRLSGWVESSVATCGDVSNSAQYAEGRVHCCDRLSFLAGCFPPLALGLYLSGVLTPVTAVKSLMGLVVVLLGFRIGELLRGRVSQEIFRKFVLIAFLFMGLRLIIAGMF